MNNKVSHHGYSFLELILAMAVGSIILAGTYTSYVVVSKQYNRGASFAETQENGLAALRLISRDLRMAGYKALDSSLESTYGAISTPIDITDSGDACCDSVYIIYDKATNDRKRIRYYIAARTNPARNALYMDIDTWDGAAWSSSTSAALVVDYVEDLQFVGSDLTTGNDPALVDVSIITRSKTARAKTSSYGKNTYDVGNYNINSSDLFHRDEFNATINIRNLRE